MFRKDLLKAHLRERFHVTPKDGSQSFEGILASCTKQNYQFVDVRVNGQPAASPLFIDRNNVSYMQSVLVISEPSMVVTNAVG